MPSSVTTAAFFLAIVVSTISPIAAVVIAVLAFAFEVFLESSAPGEPDL